MLDGHYLLEQDKVILYSSTFVDFLLIPVERT